jgi:hypothetical protein
MLRGGADFTLMPENFATEFRMQMCLTRESKAEYAKRQEGFAQVRVAHAAMGPQDKDHSKTGVDLMGMGLSCSEPVFRAHTHLEFGGDGVLKRAQLERARRGRNPLGTTTKPAKEAVTQQQPLPRNPASKVPPPQKISTVGYAPSRMTAGSYHDASTEGWKWIETGGLANEEDDPCIRMHRAIKDTSDATKFGLQIPLARRRCNMQIILEQKLRPQPLDLDRPRDKAIVHQYPRKTCELTKGREARKFWHQHNGAVPDAYPGGARAKPRFQSQRNHWHMAYGPQ